VADDVARQDGVDGDALARELDRGESHEPELPGLTCTQARTLEKQPSRLVLMTSPLRESHLLGLRSREDPGV
jgi:hypothetical protein